MRSNNIRENGAPVGIQAILEAGHCRSFSDVWRQSIPRSGRTNSKSRFPPGKVKTWLTDLAFVPSEVTSSWRFKELLRRQVQVTMEQLVHRDGSSTEKHDSEHDSRVNDTEAECPFLYLFMVLQWTSKAISFGNDLETNGGD